MQNNKYKKVLFIFGTRPEAIKMAPIINKFREHKNKIQTIVCVTGQHSNLLAQMLDVFKIIPEYNLNVMRQNQTLFQTTSRILLRLEKILKKEEPDIVLVQGDTTTAFIASLATFYFKIKVGHIEAGLRSFDKFQPFPEEINRKCVDVLSDFYFAPTKLSKNNLVKEGVSEKKIFVTGNTIVDALNMIKPHLNKLNIKEIVPNIDLTKRIILVTAHRRENFGVGMKNITLALKEIEMKNKDIEIVFPVHPNPNVSNIIRKLISKSNKRIHIIDSLDYFCFLKILESSILILSDSGGVQEEAPSFQKPVLILREVTERPEVIDSGFGKLVGTNKELIIKECQKIIDQGKSNRKVKQNPFGDGSASLRILKILLNENI